MGINRKLTSIMAMLLCACTISDSAGAAPNEYGRPSFSASSQDACIKGGLIAVIAYGVFAKNSTEVGVRKSALAGCAILVGANEYLEQKRKVHANRQQRLLSEIEDIIGHNEELSVAIRRAELSIEADEQTLKRLEIERMTNRKTVEEQRNALRNLRRSNDKNYRQLMADAIRIERHWRLVAKAESQTGPEPTELKFQIGEMRKIIRTLEREYADLNDRYESYGI